MDYSIVEPALQAWVSALSGIPLNVTLWENAPRVRHNGVLALLSWVSVTKVGTDDAAWEYDAGAVPLEQMVPVVKGPRRAVLQIDVESYQQVPGQTARAYLEALRDRVRAPSSVAALSAINLGFVQASPVTKADYRTDSHKVSRSLLEVTFNCSAFAVDTAGMTSYIASVDTTASILNVDGVPLATSLQPSGSLP